VWQPNVRQWRVIWPIAILLVLFWPGLTPDDPSLAVKAVNFVADPRGTLPQLPDDYTMADEDDIATVEAHDAQETAYDKYYGSAWFARLRIHMRDLQEPFDPGTERQALIAVSLLGALLVWRLNGKKQPKESSPKRE